MLDQLDSVAKFMVLLGMAGGVYTLTYAVLIWRGHFDKDDGMDEDYTDPNERG